MADQYFHRDNHYVSVFYLKNWSSSQGRLWVYRVLISSDQVPLWKEIAIKGIAYHSNLYTRIVGGQETDEFEQWLDKEFESPAAEPIRKVVSGIKLESRDWRRLARFVAAQDVRTPARLIENLQRWDQTLPGILSNCLEGLPQTLEKAIKEGGAPSRKVQVEGSEYIPLRVTTETLEGQVEVIVKAETLVGRGLWLFSMKHVLIELAKILEQHRWTILTPPGGMSWITSDDPVIRLNFYRQGHYDFKGGWGSKGTEILFPLSPQHLLYTQIGQRPTLTGFIQRDQAEMIRKFIAEHAHRMIFASERDPEIQKLRPRIVNPEQVTNEKEQWRSWHEKQTLAERSMMNSHQKQQRDESNQ